MSRLGMLQLVVKSHSNRFVHGYVKRSAFAANTVKHPYDIVVFGAQYHAA